MSLVLHVHSAHTNANRWPAGSNCLGLAVGREYQWGGLVVNKGTLRVNCAASEWPLPLVHSNEQERVIIFLFKVNSPPLFWQACKYGQTWSSWGKNKFHQLDWKVCSLVWYNLDFWLKEKKKHFFRMDNRKNVWSFVHCLSNTSI